MKKLIIITLLLALLMPLVSANDMGVLGQTTQLWADVLNGAAYYSATAANITVYHPNGTVAFSNQPMTLIATGRYLYNFTPNTTGTHYTFTTFANATSIVATATSTFYIQSADIAEGSNMAALAVIIAIGIAIAIFSYMAFAFKSENNGTNAVWKVLSLIIVVLLLVLLAWSSIDANQACAFVADSTGYNYVCETGPATAGSMFLKLMLLVTTIFFIWISISLAISSIEKLRETGRL